MRRIVLLLVIASAASLVSACGGDSPSVSPDAVTELESRVSAVRGAVGAHDVDGARRSLDALRTSVDRLRRSDELSGDRAAEILASADSVQARLVTIATTTTTTSTTTTTTTTVPPTAPSVDADAQGEGGGKGQGKGQGKGGDKNKD